MVDLAERADGLGERVVEGGERFILGIGHGEAEQGQRFEHVLFRPPVPVIDAGQAAGPRWREPVHLGGRLDEPLFGGLGLLDPGGLVDQHPRMAEPYPGRQRLHLDLCGAGQAGNVQLVPEAVVNLREDVHVGGGVAVMGFGQLTRPAFAALVGLVERDP